MLIKNAREARTVVIEEQKPDELAVKVGSTLIVFIYDYIDAWGFDAAQFIPALEAAGGVENIIVKINSKGGDAWDGAAIYNALVQHKERYGSKVTVEIYGLAASAASMVAMAGDERLIGSMAEIMIHKAWVGVAGNSDHLRKIASQLDGMDEEMALLYTAKSNLSADEVRALLTEGDTYFAGQDAIDAGFATGRLPEAQEQPSARAALGDNPRWDAIEYSARVATRMSQNPKARAALAKEPVTKSGPRARQALEIARRKALLRRSA